MPILPTLNIENITILYGSALTALALMWGISKAISLLKSH